MSRGSSMFSSEVPGVITAATVYSRVSSVLFFGSWLLNDQANLYRCNVSASSSNFQQIRLYAGPSTMPVPVNMADAIISGIAVNGQFLYLSVQNYIPATSDYYGHVYRIDISQNPLLFSYSTPDQSTINVYGVVDILPSGISTGGIAVSSSNDVYVAVNNNQIVVIRNSVVTTRYTGSIGSWFGSMAIDPAEKYLYFSDWLNSRIFSYNIADSVEDSVKVVSVGTDQTTGISATDTEVYFVRSGAFFPFTSIVYAQTSKREAIVAGGGNATSGDPLSLRLLNSVDIYTCGFSVDNTTGYIYVSSRDNPTGIIGSSKMYQIELSLSPRPLPTVAPPKQRQVQCGLAEFGSCKRVTVPFSPREYWGWGSPNRPYFTPDPNVGCIPAYVYTGDHPCPEVRQPAPAPAPAPPPAPPPTLLPYTEKTTTDFASRSFNYLTTGISSLTLVNTISTNAGSRPTAPALGSYGQQLYMLTSNGNIYSLLASPMLSNSVNDSLVDTSPAISITSGSIMAATANKVTLFDESLNFLWSSNIAQCFSPAFGSGNTVFLANSNTLRALETTAPSNVWTYTFPEGEAVSSPPTADSGIVLLGTTAGSIYSFDQASGNIIWVYKTGTNTPVYSTPNYTFDNRIVFACGANIFNIDYDRVIPYRQTRTYTSLSGNVASSFATAFDPSGNMWTYYTTNSNALFGICMLDDSGNFTGWASTDSDLTPAITPVLDPLYVYVTSARGIVRRYSAFPGGLVQNSIVQKSSTSSYTISATIVNTPSVITTASNQLVVFDAAAKCYIFQ